MKKCPYCAEQIQDEAVVCRYCQRDLPRKPRQKVTPIKQKPVDKEKQKRDTRSLIWFFVIIGSVIMIMLCVGVIFSPTIPSANEQQESSRGSSSSSFVFDVPSILGKKRSSLDENIGSSSDVDHIPSGELSNMPSGGESRTYQKGKYKYWIFYDSMDIARGFQIVGGLESNHYTLDDIRSIKAITNISVSGSPDFQSALLKRWENFGGYEIMMAKDLQSGWVWTIQVLKLR